MSEFTQWVNYESGPHDPAIHRVGWINYEGDFGMTACEIQIALPPPDSHARQRGLWWRSRKTRDEPVTLELASSPDRVTCLACLTVGQEP